MISEQRLAYLVLLGQAMDAEFGGRDFFPKVGNGVGFSFSLTLLAQAGSIRALVQDWEER